VKAFVTRGFEKGTVGLRNKALAYLYASRVMPVGALVNVRVGDYNPSAGTLKVSLRKGAPATTVKLSRPVQTSLKRYIAALGAQVAPTDPMFGAVGTGAVDIKTATCSAELKRFIAQRAKAAKLSTSRIYVK
jgi:site-specific recombinase XerD